MPTLGSTEKVALAVMARFIFVLSIPMATPARQARTINTTHTAATKATMVPQMRYTGALLSLCNMSIRPLLFIVSNHMIPYERAAHNLFLPLNGKIMRNTCKYRWTTGTYSCIIYITCQI